MDETTDKPTRPPHPPRSFRKKIGFRVGAVALGLAPFVLLELSLIALDLGNPDLHTDPFVGFSKTLPLFTLNQDDNRYWTAPARREFFYPDSFAADKPKNEFRVFCLGGSTVQGRPYSIETAFGAWLELTLKAAQPNRPIRVVNCGGISYASYRLVPVLREVLGYQPDLIILYTGHNEFLEDRTYGDLKNMSAVTAASMKASRLRAFPLLRRLVHPDHEPLGDAPPPSCTRTPTRCSTTRGAWPSTTTTTPGARVSSRTSASTSTAWCRSPNRRACP
jgi:hypothetical protein